MIRFSVEKTGIRMSASVTLITHKWEVIYPNYPIGCFYKFFGFLYPCIILMAGA
jgi:hypothetical protein